MAKHSKVTNLTAERAKRGRLPWTFFVDVATNEFRATVNADVRFEDLAAMAEELERWGRALLAGAETLRKFLG